MTTIICKNQDLTLQNLVSFLAVSVRKRLSGLSDKSFKKAFIFFAFIVYFNAEKGKRLFHKRAFPRWTQCILFSG